MKVFGVANVTVLLVLLTEIPDFGEAIVLRQGATVETICKVIHKDLVNQFKYALVWGSSAKHSPQKCGLGKLAVSRREEGERESGRLCME